MKQLGSLACVIALALQACGGGGGSASPSEPAITPPPSFVSPHPETWETQSATDAGFNATALSDAFELRHARRFVYPGSDCHT
jgi:hypothetical protein